MHKDTMQTLQEEWARARSLEDRQLQIEGLMIALMVCRRQLIGTFSREVQEVMGSIVKCIDKIEQGTFDYPTFIEKETKL